MEPGTPREMHRSYKREVFRPIEGAVAEAATATGSRLFVGRLLSLRCQGRDPAIFGLHDERGDIRELRPARIRPVRRTASGVSVGQRPQRRVFLALDLPVSCRQLLGRQLESRAELHRPFEGHPIDVLVREDALHIRVAPRRSRWRPTLRRCALFGGARRGLAREGRRCQREDHDHGRQRAERSEKSCLHLKSPFDPVACPRNRSFVPWRLRFGNDAHARVVSS